MRRPTTDQMLRRRAAVIAVAVVVLLASGALAVTGLRNDSDDPDARVVASNNPETSEPPGDPIQPAAPTTTTSTGRFVVAPGTSEEIGDGVLHTYRVEAEDGTGVDPAEFAAEVEIILSSEQGWTTADGIALQRVDADADIVVTLATPSTVDLLCFPLRTQGQVSCAQEQRAVINLDRWQLGAQPSRLDIADYRTYVISHEVGHTLGHDHVDCPSPGAPAPVMMQQTHGIGECAPNPWPVPVEDRAGG